MIKTTLISAGAAMSDVIEAVSDKGMATVGVIKFQPFDYIPDSMLARYDELSVKDNRLVAMGRLHLVHAESGHSKLDGLHFQTLSIDGSMKHGSPIYCGETRSIGEFTYDSALNHFPEKRAATNLIGAGVSISQTNFVIQPKKELNSREFSARCLVWVSGDDLEKIKALKLRFAIKYSMWLNEDA